MSATMFCAIADVKNILGWTEEDSGGGVILPPSATERLTPEQVETRIKGISSDMIFMLSKYYQIPLALTSDDTVEYLKEKCAIWTAYKLYISLLGSDELPQRVIEWINEIREWKAGLKDIQLDGETHLISAVRAVVPKGKRTQQYFRKTGIPGIDAIEPDGAYGDSTIDGEWDL